MTLDYLFLARHGTTSPDGTFNVFAGGLDTITVSECPGRFGITVVGRLSRIAGRVDTARLKLDLLDPAGLSMLDGTLEVPMVWAPASPQADAGLLARGSEPFLVSFDDLPFDTPGRHRIVVSFVTDGDQAADTARGEVPLTVRVRDAAG